MFNNNFSNNPMFSGGTSYPNQKPQERPVMRNMLNKQQASMLQQQSDSFDVKLTEREFYKAICTHKNPETGAITLTKLPNGKHHCSICGEEFYLLNLNTPDEDIIKILSNVNDLFQTIKTYYGNAPDALKDLYIIQGFLSKFLPLWHIAKSYFENATNAAGGNVQQNSDQYAFQALANAFGGGLMGGMIPGMNGGYYNNAPQYGAATMPPNYGGGQPNYGTDPQYGAASMPPNYGGGQPNYTGQPSTPNNGYVYAGPNPNISNNGGYGINTANYGNTGAVPNNPMGYVETPAPTPDYAQKSGVVSMPGVNPNAGTQPTPVAAPQPEMPPISTPEPPKNPNIKETPATTAKTNVSKNFK